MFEFSRMGLILFATGVIFFLLFGRWLLPERQALSGGDVLLVRGKLRELIRLKDTANLELNVAFKLRDETLQSEDLRLVQALVALESDLIDHTLKELDFRNR